MIKLIVEQSEQIPFSLYFTEKDGKPIFVRKWSLPWGFKCETEEERTHPVFDIIELEEVMNDADTDSFVQSVIGGTYRTHHLSKEFRTERDRQRLKQCEDFRK